MKRYAFIIVSLLFSACSLIDDDLSVCGTDCYLSYDMRLDVNVEAVIEDKLSMVGDAPIADALRTWLAPTFSGFAHDLDMHFYSPDEEDALRQTRHEIVDATHATYTLYIPRADYMHVALVNTMDNENISVVGASHSATIALHQSNRDTLSSYNTAIYTARQSMLMSDTTTHTYHVNLYMVNSAVALIVDSDEKEMMDMKVLVSGTASEFSVRDSVYSFTHPSLIRMNQINKRCYAVVTMPSPDAASFSASARMPATGKGSHLWQLRAYTAMPDGTTTETLINVNSPLKAETLEIIRVKQMPDGSLQLVQNIEASVSVTLDWKDAGSHTIDL